MFDWKFNLHAFLFCGIGVALTFSTVSFSIKSSKLTRYLGRISLPIFMFHGFIRNSLDILLRGHSISITQYVIMILLSTVMCVLLMYFTDFVVSIFQTIQSKALNNLSD